MSTEHSLQPLPAATLLPRVLEAILTTVPKDMSTLLASQRFATGASALERLAGHEHREAALRSLAPAEAEWLGGELLERWKRLGQAALPPAIAIVVTDDGPGAPGERVTVALAADGILPGWTAHWHGATAAPDGATAVVTLKPSEDSGPASVRVHVHARRASDGARCALVAETSVGLRPPT